MTDLRMLELLKIERECVTRGENCNRDCANCDLVQDADELIEMYDKVIRFVANKIINPS